MGRIPRLLPSLVLAALLVPSTQDLLFNGFPFSTPLEYAAFIVLLPLLASRAIARTAVRGLRRTGPRAAVVAAMAVASIGLKGSLLASGDPAGFAACYRYIGDETRPSGCERSFENPLGGGRVTRIDREIAFTPDNWNLSFINSNRFNFGSWMENRPLRHRLPIGASWSARVDNPARHTLVVDYVGEGTVTLGRASVVMPASYGQPARVILAAPEGEQRLLVDFSFNDHSRTDGPRMTTPYATLHVFLEAHDGRRIPFAFVPAGVSGFRTVLGWLSDALLLALVLAAAALHVGLLWPDRVWALATALGVAGSLWCATALDVPPSATAPLVPVLVLWALLARPHLRRLVLAWLACLAAGLAAFGPAIGPLARVSLRSPGDDWLTYESLARAVFEDGLRGGEPVFYYQPLFRYVRATERLLFGDGDLLIVATGFALLAVAVMLVPRGCARGRPRTERLVCAVAGTSMLGVVLSPFGASFLLLGASESPTWVLLPAAAALLLAARARPSTRVLGAALLAASVLARTNQLPGALAILAAGVLVAHDRRVRAGMLLVAVLLLLLPLAHNVYYGGRAVLFTSSSDITANRVVPLDRLVDAPHDAAVRATLVRQLRHVVVAFPLTPPLIGARYEWTVWWTCIRVVQLLWMGVAVVTIARWRASAAGLLVAAAPLLYLAVHVVYQVEPYYPRHVIVGHLACGITASYLATRPERARTPDVDA